MAEFKKKVAAVVGPTASGKTSLAVMLCQALSGEVVSCDSMQIYKGMQIGTAAPTEEEMQGIPHHLIGFVSPDEEFSVARYCELAKKCIDGIVARGNLPVITGGTGLYFNSLIDNIEFFEEDNNGECRAQLKLRAQTEGAQVLLDELYAIDPETAKALHVNNLGRIIRALEVYLLTGKTLSETKRLSRLKGSELDPVIIGLDARDRSFLYDRINRRVDMMLESGLVDEAKRFYSLYSGKTSSQAIGYKEFLPYLNGEKSLEECAEQLKLQTRHYAKRQLTWFKKDERIRFLMIDDYSCAEELFEEALKIIKEGMQCADKHK